MGETAEDRLPPVHPGEILADELTALGMSARSFASHLRVPTNAVTAVINGDRGITAQMALRLARALRTTDEYWMNLQNAYELKIARHKMNDEVLAISCLVSERSFFLERRL